MNARTGEGSRLRFVDRLKRDLRKHYADPRAITADKRLKRREQMELLEAWPSADDYERGRVELIKEELQEFLNKEPTDAQP